MADISACSGVIENKVLGIDNKSKIITKKCPQRHSCKRYEAHLNAASKQQSYIKAAFVGQSCEFLKE